MTPLIIDCDPGIDDALALLLAAASPEFELLAVTTVTGNRPLDVTTRNACRLMALAGRSEVPVHAGCGRPIADAAVRCNLVHGEDGLGGVELPDGPDPAAGHASDVLASLLLGAPPQTIDVAAIGPLTNLALAELRHPGLLRRARSLLIMGGAAFRPGNVTPSAEFNFYADPLAAHLVLTAGADVKLFGLDVTSQVAMSAAWIESLAALDTRSAQAAHAMLAAYARFDPLLHDACPLVWLLAPELFGGKPCELSVDWRPGPTEGHTIAWEPKRRDRPFAANALVFTDVDADRVLGLVRERLARLP